MHAISIQVSLQSRPSPERGIPDYFDELLERYGDYESSSSETTRFFQIIQNKLHYPVTGKTAAELIQERANAGSVSKSAADQAAKDQYDPYIERRRGALEHEGQDETIRALEEPRRCSVGEVGDISRLFHLSPIGTCKLPS